MWKGKEVDPYERKKIFYEQVAPRLVERFPATRFFAEHISTKEAVQFVLAYPHLFATITPQHLINIRTHVLGTGVDLALVCKPEIQPEPHYDALRDAIVLGGSQIMAGTDAELLFQRPRSFSMEMHMQHIVLIGWRVGRGHMSVKNGMKLSQIVIRMRMKKLTLHDMVKSLNGRM
jgi:hypothetical protein